MAELESRELAQRRPFRPRAPKRLEEWNVDLVEHLVASPTQLNAEVGDELQPIEASEPLVAFNSPSTDATPLAPACCMITGNAA